MTDLLTKSISHYSNYKLLHLLNKDLAIFDMLFTYLKRDEDMMTYIYELAENDSEFLRKAIELLTKNYLNEKYQATNITSFQTNLIEYNKKELDIYNQITKKFENSFNHLIEQLIAQIQAINLFEFDVELDLHRIEQALKLLCEYKLSLILESYLPKKLSMLFTDG